MPQSREELIAIFNQCKDHIGDAIFTEFIAQRLKSCNKWKRIVRNLATKFGWTDRDIQRIKELKREPGVVASPKKHRKIDITYEQLEQICIILDRTTVKVLQTAIFLKESDRMAEKEIIEDGIEEAKYRLWEFEQKEKGKSG